MQSTISERKTQWVNSQGNRRLLNQLFQGTFRDAAKSFSQLVNKDMVIDHYKIEQVTSDEFSRQVVDQLEHSYFGSIIRLEETFNANIVFLIPEKEGIGLYQLITGEPVKYPSIITQDMIAGIGELNNILGGKFINSLANFLGISIHGTTPMNTFDMLGAILDSIAIQDEFINREVICADAKIREKDQLGYEVRLIIMSEMEQLIHTLEQI